MRFSAEWQDPGVSASAELKATFCLLAMDLDGKRISRFFDQRYGRLQDRWSLIQASLADEEERAFCEAAGALGIDPYLCDEGEAQAIEQAAKYFDDEALLEFLASQHGQKPVNALRWLAAAEMQLGDKAALPYIADIAGNLRPQKEKMPFRASHPWQLGYRLAEQCRAMV